MAERKPTMEEMVAAENIALKIGGGFFVKAVADEMIKKDTQLASKDKQIDDLKAERDAILGKKIFHLDTEKVGTWLLNYAPEQAVGIFTKWKEERDNFQKENADLKAKIAKAEEIGKNSFAGTTVRMVAALRGD